MSKLIVTLDGQLIKEVELDKERVTIGRRPNNDIQIDNLAVSGEHAAITTLLNDSFLEDLGSTNGTLVNNLPVKKHVLQHGDEIEIGKYCLKFINLESIGAKKEPQDFEKTMILRPGQVLPTPPAGKDTSDMGGHTIPLTMPDSASPVDKTLPPGQSPGEGGENQAVIQILNGPNSGKELALTKTLTSLGKAGGQVAVITRRPHGYFITHVQGDSYPVVNGQTLDAHPRQLEDHDVIELAGVKMEFYLK